MVVLTRILQNKTVRGVVQAIEKSSFFRHRSALRVIIIEILLFFGSPSPIHALSPQELNKIYEDWGISVVKKELRHRFEGAVEKRGVLELRLWKEDKSLRSGVPPSPTIYCELVHQLIYGKARQNKTVGKVPLRHFFASNPQADAVRLTYFIVSYRNLPEPPQQHDNLRPSKSKIRVIWKRQEQIIPYISYEMSKQEWGLISKFIQGNATIAKTEFVLKECPQVLNIAGRFQTDFESLKQLNPAETPQ